MNFFLIALVLAGAVFVCNGCTNTTEPEGVPLLKLPSPTLSPDRVYVRAQALRGGKHEERPAIYVISTKEVLPWQPGEKAPREGEIIRRLPAQKEYTAAFDGLSFQLKKNGAVVVSRKFADVLDANAFATRRFFVSERYARVYVFYRDKRDPTFPALVKGRDVMTTVVIVPLSGSGKAVVVPQVPLWDVGSSMFVGDVGVSDAESLAFLPFAGGPTCSGSVGVFLSFNATGVTMVHRFRLHAGRYYIDTRVKMLIQFDISGARIIRYYNYSSLAPVITATYDVDAIEKIFELPDQTGSLKPHQYKIAKVQGRRIPLLEAPTDADKPAEPAIYKKNAAGSAKAGTAAKGGNKKGASGPGKTPPGGQVAPELPTSIPRYVYRNAALLAFSILALWFFCLWRQNSSPRPAPHRAAVELGQQPHHHHSGSGGGGGGGGGGGAWPLALFEPQHVEQKRSM